jgi:hypothetical protein
MSMSRPLALLGARQIGPYADALRLERRTKRLSHEAKLDEARRAACQPEWCELLRITGHLKGAPSTGTD